MSANKHKSRGFSLLEIILAVATIGILFSFYLKMSDKQSNERQGRRDADTEAVFANAAQQYFATNRLEMLAAMAETTATTSVQAHCVVSVTNLSDPIAPGTSPGNAGANGTLSWSSDKKTCAFDASFLKAKGLWPNDVMGGNDPDMGGEWRWASIFRRVTSNSVLTDNVEMLVVKMDVDGVIPTLSAAKWSADSARKQAADAARNSMGFAGGVMPIGDVGWCKATKTQTEICGNGWKADLNQFLDATQLTGLRNSLPD